jgi:hypothetical protein
MDPDWTPPVEYSSFCGEAVLREAYEEAHSWDTRGYIPGLFVTGARASEFLQYKCNQFEYDKLDNVYWGRNLPVLKREPGAKRTINYLAEDPVAKEFWEFLERVRKSCGQEAYVTEFIRKDRNEWLLEFEHELDWYKKETASFSKQKAEIRVSQHLERAHDY